jgi:hypothetical protein
VPAAPAQTVDDWWSNAAVCLIPGTPGIYPATFDTYNVCGGQQAVQTLPLQDVNSITVGQIFIFRTYDSQLIVTATLNAGKPILNAGSAQ